MSGVDDRKEPVVDKGEPTLRSAAYFTLGTGLVLAGAALVEECLRRFHFVLALINLLFAGWLFGWLRCHDQERERYLLQTLDDRERELHELQRARSGGPDAPP